MDNERFDELARILSTARLTRVGVIRGLGAGALAALAAASAPGIESDAKRKRRRAGKKGKQVSQGGRGGSRQSRSESLAVPCPTPGNADKVLWCHATSSATNPYEQVCVDDSAVDDTGGSDSNHSAHEGDCGCGTPLCICDPTDKKGACCKCAQAAPVCNKNACNGPNGVCAAEPDPDQNDDPCGDPAPICQKRVCDNGECVLKPDEEQNGDTCGDPTACTQHLCDNGECVVVDDPDGDPCDASGDGTSDGFCCDGVCYDCPEDQTLDLATCSCVGGCTLTQGYWKTHSLRGPAPYDDAWLAIGAAGADTPFFSSGQTYYEVLWTPPSGGNVYYQLAHQYIAAKLNVLNGASAPSAVTTAIGKAESWFVGKTPSTPLTKAQKTEASGLASILGSYNEGAIGPGHCD
jgi:hypothetical protein